MNESVLIRACIPTEQGYCKVSMGSCYDKHMSESSSQLAVAVYRWGIGRSPQQWWFDKACSSESQCTVRSTGADRHECCSSPGEWAEWDLVMCSWPCTTSAFPSGKKHAKTNTCRGKSEKNASKHCDDLGDLQVKRFQRQCKARFENFEKWSFSGYIYPTFQQWYFIVE